MKKIYSTPSIETIRIKTMHMIAGSEGVNNGDSVGNNYNSEDVTYSRRGNWSED